MIRDAWIAAVVWAALFGTAGLVLSAQGEADADAVFHGGTIYTMADGARTVRDIVAAICTEYDVEPPQAEADALAFLTELEAKGVISA